MKWQRWLFPWGKPAAPPRAEQEIAALRAELAQAHAALGERIAGLEREAARQGREQSRALTLLEGQAGALEDLAGGWQDHLRQRQRESEQIGQALDDLEYQVGLRLVEDLLPVADALGQSIEAARHLREHLTDPAVGAQADAWLQGLRLVDLRLLGVLDRAGVQPIAAVGRPFDPRRHRAVATAPRTGAADGTVIAEERRGYLLGERVLRHAEVVVARGEPAGPGQAAPGEEFA